MDNKTLDDLLKALKTFDKGNAVMSDAFWAQNEHLLNGNEWEPIRDYLQGEGYIDHNQYHRERYWIKLTPKGVRFINDGGFTADKYYKVETLRVAQKSKTNSFWAVVLGVLSIVVAVVLWYIGDHHK